MHERLQHWTNIVWFVAAIGHQAWWQRHHRRPASIMGAGRPSYPDPAPRHPRRRGAKPEQTSFRFSISQVYER